MFFKQLCEDSLGGSELERVILPLGSSSRDYREGNGTHSSTLARKIPWMEEPGRLQSVGLLRVGHN